MPNLTELESARDLLGDVMHACEHDGRIHDAKELSTKLDQAIENIEKFKASMDEAELFPTEEMPPDAPEPSIDNAELLALADKDPDELINRIFGQV